MSREIPTVRSFVELLNLDWLPIEEKNDCIWSSDINQDEIDRNFSDWKNTPEKVCQMILEKGCFIELSSLGHYRDFNASLESGDQSLKVRRSSYTLVEAIKKVIEVVNPEIEKTTNTPEIQRPENAFHTRADYVADHMCGIFTMYKSFECEELSLKTVYLIKLKMSAGIGKKEYLAYLSFQ